LRLSELKISNHKKLYNVGLEEAILKRVGNTTRKKSLISPWR